MLSDLFFTINYWVVIVLAIISLFLCFLIIVIVIFHRECHNFTNALTCNTCVAVALYFIFRVVESIFALRRDWQYHQPACVFRAYCVLRLCAAFCYSYSIQAVSRLFFAVFYKYKFLLTWRAHWILIAINWLVRFTIPIEPLFYRDGYELVRQSRNCVITAKYLSMSIFLISTVFVIPLNTVTIAYGVIIHRVRQSTRRVAPVAPSMITSAVRRKTPALNGKRELKTMRNMFVQGTIISLGGVLFLILLVWDGTQQQPAPESFYLLSFGFVSLFTTFMMIALFLMNTVVRKIAVNYVFRSFQTNMQQPPMCQPIARLNVHRLDLRREQQ